MNRYHFYRAGLVLVVFALLITAASPAIAADMPATQPVDRGKPVILADARQYDFTSKINGLTYRIFIYTPPKLDLTKPAPVIYVFDGNYYFAAGCNAMSMNQLAGILVGVGYPSDDNEEIGRRRSFDLSLTTRADDPKHGGGDAFLRVVDEEVKPLVAAHCRIDPTQQSIFGHSLGGLMVLRQLFRNPQAYSTYIAASPSIWWASRAVLGDEDAFTKRAGDLRLRLLITSAEDEQYHGDDPAQLEKVKRNGMVDNATNLAARLAPHATTEFTVTREILPHENHRSGSIGSLVRGLNFMFHGAD